jgi:lysophospholipase L1-like esterase
MNKNYKKSVAAFAALSIAATTAVVPVNVFADETSARNIAVESGEAIFTSDVAAVGIVAEYDGDRLTSVVKVDVPADGTAAKLPVKEGDKVMLWDSLNGMTPLADTVTVQAAAETTAPTDKPSGGATETTAPTDEATASPEATDEVTSTPEATDAPTATPEATDAPTATPGATENPDATVWKFDFGSADDVAEGYTAVTADTAYSNSTGYGLLGLENGFAQDARDDGWTMTQGYDLKLENGTKSDNVTAADDDFVACTYDETVGNIGMVSPIRFAMKSDTNSYYKVKVKLTRADASKEANVSLFTEKRHQHLVNEPIPAEGLEYETSVYVHNNWSKSTYEYVDTMLNVTAIGDNVAISSIEVEKQETPGKTLWVLGDSTVCEQTAAIPYFPLDHCQGVGSAMAKYLGTDWALVNEAESGLSASASKNHFNNMINDVKPGDIVWFEFGHNDDKVTNDPSTNGYLSTLESYYNQVTAKGASFVAVAPIDRDTTNQWNSETNTWSSTLSHYSTAAKSFVESKISDGATNIAFIDLNAPTISFLDEISKEITDAGYSYNAAATRFYYYVSKMPGYQNDYTHPNDYGADNFASNFVNEANKVIASATDDDADNSTKLQAAILSSLLEGQRNATATRVPESIYSLGAPANSAYPNALVKVVYYDYPWLISNAVFDDDGYIVSLTGKSVPCEKLSSVYGRGVVEIYNADGSLKGKVTSSGDVAFYDSSISGDQALTFDNKTVAYDASAGETYKVYVTDIDQSGNDSDTVVSNVLTEQDNVDVKEYLLQGSIGTENKEDFSSYDLTAGDSIIGKNSWTNPGGETFAYAEENGVTYAHCVTTGSATYYPEKKFTAVKDGQLFCRFDLRYVSGTFNLYFTDGTALNNWPAGRIMPVQVKADGGEVKVFLNGTAVATVNANEWVTYALTIDMDYGTYTLKVNGQTYTADFDAYQTNEVVLTPSNLSLIAFQNDKSANEYDVTNIVLATLNTSELPNKTLTVASEDETKGNAYTSDGVTDVILTSVSMPMNSTVKAYAVANSGYAFKDWIDENGNVVSYSPEYEIRLHNDISITAEFEAEIVDPINYAYIERFSTLSTSTLSSNGWVSPNAQTNATVEQDSDHGNYLQFAPGQANDRNVNGTFPTEANLSENYVLEFDMAVTPGNNHASDIAVYDTSASVGSNSPVDSNYILKLNNGAANSTSWTVNGSSDTVELTKGEWLHYYLLVKPADQTVEIVISNGTTELFNKTEAINGTGVLGGINILSGRYQGVTKLDNIKVYTADQIQG